MLEIITPYKRFGKTFFRCKSDGVVIYLTLWQLTMRGKGLPRMVTIPVVQISPQTIPTEI